MTDVPLDHLARRVAADPFFLGFRLAGFVRLHGLDDAALAARLGCAPGVLATVRLCRAPRPDPAGFREDVLCVAEKFGLNPLALAEAAKPLPAAPARPDGAVADSPGVVLAARDRGDPP